MSDQGKMKDRVSEAAQGMLAPIERLIQLAILEERARTAKKIRKVVKDIKENYPAYYRNALSYLALSQLADELELPEKPK